MPKAKKKDSPKDQKERFEKAVQELVDAGELNPIEADNELERLVRVFKGDKGGSV